MTNFTLLDTAGAMQAMVGFSAILFAPGYLLASVFDLFGFRARSLLERIAWAVGLSFAVSPAMIVLMGRLMPLGGVATLFAALTIAMAAVLLLQRHSLRIPVNKYTILLALLLVLGVALVIGELIDLQSGNRLFLSVTVADQCFRVAFINAIAHTGIPPQNPLYHPGVAAPLRYYYFWYAVCALCMKLAHVSARQGLIASSCWAAIGLTAMIALFARHFLGIRERLYRYILTTVLLLAVTGLDIMPVLYNLIAHHDFSGDLEWWSSDQISSWLDSILWVPHHVAALLCCLVAFLLLWRSRDAGVSRQQHIAATVLAGVSAASAFGLSVYVAAGFAILMAGWSANLLLREGDKPQALRNAAAVATAAALSLPYLRDMLHSTSGTQAGTATGPAHLLQFGVRMMIAPDLVTGLPAFAEFNRNHPILLQQMVALVLLIPGYILELGAFGVALVLMIQARKRLDLPHRTALGMTVGGLILVSFVRSAVIGNNDFGYRAALFPCFFLLLMLAQILSSAPSNLQKPILSLAILVGVAGTGFQALMLRAYVPLHVAAHMPDYEGLPEAAFATRSIYEAATAVIPAQAIVQPNLGDPGDTADQMNLLYSERGLATDSADDCGAVFGGDPTRCAPTQQAVRELFVSPAPTAAQAIARCHALGINYLSVARNDPAWQDTNGWVWTLPTAGGASHPGTGFDGTANDWFRVVQCGTGPASQP